MYCSKCGKQLPENALFCPGCGATVRKKEAGQQGSQTVKPQNAVFVNQKSDAASLTVLISCVINIICAVMYILPWIKIKAMEIPEVFSSASHSYNIIDLFRVDKSTAVTFYKYFFDKNIGFWMNILTVVCCVGCIAFLWHIVSAVYLLLKKKDTPIPYVRYMITGIIAIIFIIASIWLKAGDFSVLIAIDPELTGGQASGASFDFTNSLSVTIIPIITAVAAAAGFIKSRKK